MPAAIDIPQRFTTEDPGRLKTELERLSAALDVFTRGLATEIKRVEIPDINQSAPALSYGQIRRLPTVNDGDTLNIALPRANAKDIGRRCGVLRASGTGIVVLHAAVGTVAGVTTYTVCSDPHFVEFLLGNDLNFYPSRQGAATA